MCEHCGCQSLVVIDELTREHDQALEHIRAARAAIGRDDLAGAAQQAALLLELLAPHTAVEEQALFPAMAEEHPEHVAVLHREHEHVHAVLGAVALGDSDGRWQQQLAGALDVLREHIAKEQDGLFPAALISLRTRDWEAAEQVRALVGTALRPPARL